MFPCPLKGGGIAPGLPQMGEDPLSNASHPHVVPRLSAGTMDSVTMQDALCHDQGGKYKVSHKKEIKRDEMGSNGLTNRTQSVLQNQ